MEKAVNYELQDRKDGDNLQLISGSVASTLPTETYSRIDRKEAQRSNCMIYCCIFSVAVIAVLALCAAVAAIILVAAFPNVTNPAVQEVLVLKDQLTAQLASTSTPSTNADATRLSEEIQMIREALQTSLNSIDSSIQTSLNSIGTSIEASLNLTSKSIKASLKSIDTSLQISLNFVGTSVVTSMNSSSISVEASLNSIETSVKESLSSMGSLIERLVEAQENGTCEVPPDPPVGSAANPAKSCRDISADLPSGDYWIQSNDTSCPIRAYCDLDGSACSCRCDTEEGGWMRVANFDMTDPNQNCPDGFTQVDSTDPPLRLCGRPGPVGCSIMVFPVNGIEYSRVCGSVIGYQFATPDAFSAAASQGLDGHYIDGVSITHGFPRTHIWTFANSLTSTDGVVGCPCDTNSYQGTVPSFIGQDYFCESGYYTGGRFLYPNNPLWDGSGCRDTSTCCVLNSPPYFCQTLATPTTNDIEVRVCGNQDTGDEDTPIEKVKIYVY